MCYRLEKKEYQRSLTGAKFPPEGYKIRERYALWRGGGRTPGPPRSPKDPLASPLVRAIDLEAQIKEI